jgi:hypothetical protein
MPLLAIMVSKVQGNLASYAHFGGYSNYQAQMLIESSTATDDNAMLPEATFSL